MFHQNGKLDDFAFFFLSPQKNKHSNPQLVDKKSSLERVPETMGSGALH